MVTINNRCPFVPVLCIYNVCTCVLTCLTCVSLSRSHHCLFLYLQQALDWCIESAGILSGFDLLSSSQDFDPAAAIKDIDRFLDENPPPSAESQQSLMDLAELTENHWAKQNALFAYNRVMEISERFSYHSQLLENMAASGQRGGPVKQLTGVGLARIPVSSGGSTGELEGKVREQDGGLKNGESHVDGPAGVPHSVMHLDGDDCSDEDEHTDAAGAVYKSLRYLEE